MVSNDLLGNETNNNKKKTTITSLMTYPAMHIIFGLSLFPLHETINCLPSLQSWMLLHQLSQLANSQYNPHRFTGNIGFSPAFLSVVQAPISLNCSLWMILLLPSGKTLSKTMQSSRIKSFTACMSFLHEKTHETDSTFSLTLISTGSFSE